MYGGRNTAAVVSAVNDYASVSAICSWLFSRMNICHPDSAIRHELAILIPELPTQKIVAILNQCVEEADCSKALHNTSGKRLLFEEPQHINVASSDMTNSGTTVVSGTSPIDKLLLDVEATLSTEKTMSSSSKSQEILTATSSSITDTASSRIDNSRHMVVDDSSDSEMVWSFKSNEGKRSAEDKVERKSCNRWCNTKFNLQRWDDCPEEIVTEIPAGIDGWCKLKIFCHEKEMMKLTKDGRPWRTWKTSSRKHFTGVHRVTTCKGNHCCTSKDCGYVKEHGTCNKYHLKQCWA
jgi:hypothetical protein